MSFSNDEINAIVAQKQEKEKEENALQDLKNRHRQEQYDKFLSYCREYGNYAHKVGIPVEFKRYISGYSLFLKDPKYTTEPVYLIFTRGVRTSSYTHSYVHYYLVKNTTDFLGIVDNREKHTHRTTSDEVFDTAYSALGSFHGGRDIKDVFTRALNGNPMDIDGGFFK